MNRGRFIANALAIALGTTISLMAMQSHAENPSEFIDRFCIDCHTAKDASGEREFESLNFSDPHLDTQLAIQEIIDQLTLGTMPPDDAIQPTTQERLAAIEAMTKDLAQLRTKSSSNDGHTVLRRLSRREYRNTVGDLLGFDTTMFDPTFEFPADNLVENSDTVGEGQVISAHLLENYLGAAQQSVEKALSVTELPEGQEWVFREKFIPQVELRSAHSEAFENRYLCLYDHPRNDKPEGAYGYLSEFKKGVPVDGIYEIKVHAKAMNRKTTPYKNDAVKIDLDEPFRMGIRPGDTLIPDMVHNQPIEPLLAETMIDDDDWQGYTYQIRLDRGFAPRFTFENGIHDFRGSIGRVFKKHAEDLPKKIRKTDGIYDQRIALIKHGDMPHIRIDEVRVRGPLEYAWPNRSQQLVYGGADFNQYEAKSLIGKFATRAFRRPLTWPVQKRLEDFYDRRVEETKDNQQAFRDTLAAILCSPEFLYFQSAGDDQKLTAHGLAERLSYFLTSGPPDDELRSLADQDKLSDPKVLAAQAQRLLRSKDSESFVADFLDAWLNLRSLGSMPPDPVEFWFFYAAEMQSDMKAETQRFFRHVIDRNRPVSEFLESNYSFLNRDLAKLYGIQDQVPPESAGEFRKVVFDDPDRGGLLGHASILTVSANGIETSPVTRGVWLLENILGTPPPPPPDSVPAIDPDTRGATTIRDQLIKHREEEACFQCHRKIDPPGFALEGFDAIGQSRRFYDNKRKLAVDCSGRMPSGEEFAGPADFKRILLKNQTFFVRTLTQRLLTHALGRTIHASDRAEVDKILAKVAAENYPLASLIEAIVTSDMFLR
jgi:Protein of unknown function (DUF1592)/Protein of unknown function (DUF1588)/Protein of unknown function (DUF1585)/Protein of unknown function (DUF1587)/Protein of unknown function (DUF1595)/Planctomycete cytochrome C